MIPIRVDSGDYDISRNKENHQSLDSCPTFCRPADRMKHSSDRSLALSTLPERGTLLSGRAYTLDQLVKVVQDHHF
jgi:hypothetical protein